MKWTDTLVFEKGVKFMDRKAAEIRIMVRNQIRYVLEEALDGSEEIMKEVWENLESDKEDKIAKKAIKEILLLLESE